MNIESAKEWVVCCKDLLKKLSFLKDDRKLVAGAFLHLSLEHNMSITSLLESGFHGSAFALLRPQKEAFIKGIWFQRCASPQQISNFKTNGKHLSLGKMFEAVEKTPGYTHGLLSEHMNNLKDVMHDYTHGGLQQAASRDRGSMISSIYSEQQQEWLIRQTVTLSHLAILEICHVANAVKESHDIAKIFEYITITRQSKETKTVG